MIASAQTADIDPNRNRLEMIRFASDDAHLRAIDALIACGKLSVSTSQLNLWNVRTDVVRALLAANVPFEWLTRDVK
jgi:hypothetical protein